VAYVLILPAFAVAIGLQLLGLIATCISAPWRKWRSSVFWLAMGSDTGFLLSTAIWAGLIGLAYFNGKTGTLSGGIGQFATESLTLLLGFIIPIVLSSLGFFGGALVGVLFARSRAHRHPHGRHRIGLGLAFH
jgi:hypothetical protein